MPKFTVQFDDGHSVDVAPTSRDMLQLEQANITPDSVGPIQFAYHGTFAVLQRLHRLGKLDFTPPATLDALQSCADIEAVDEDPEGKGSDQGPATG